MAKKATTSKKATSKTKSAGRSSKSNIWIKIWRFIYISVISFFVLSLSWVLIYKYVNPPYTYLMCKRKAIQMISGEGSSNIHYKFVPYSQISDYLKLAVIASEDQKFPDHNGFDLVSIAKAMEKNKFTKKVKGASTISQQTAKNAFLWDGRNFIRKGLEAYFTFLIELIWGKKRILEVYLNIAEMGHLTFGAEATARTYFNKSAKKLTSSEAALIACSLPNPILFKVDNPTQFMLNRKTWIETQMINLGGINYIQSLK